MRQGKKPFNPFCSEEDNSRGMRQFGRRKKDNRITTRIYSKNGHDRANRPPLKVHICAEMISFYPLFPILLEKNTSY
jgi:hypothetical protein